MFYTHLFKKTEEFYERYERHISSFALFAGFIFDSFTLRRIDLLFENLVMLSYLIISGGSIILLNYYHESPPQRIFNLKIQNLLPLFIQFTFGGLFSAFFLFYIRSGSFSSSLIFILIMLFLLVGNEFFKGYYERLTFQVSIYFLAIFSFTIFFLPVIFKSMGALVFVLGGVLSLLVIYLFSRILFIVVPIRYKDSKIYIRNTVLAIFVLINILYFANLIPPIPLALKDAGVYQFIQRVGDNYNAIREKKEWYESLPFMSTVVHSTGAPLYVFTSIFAPTDLDTRIVHDWQHYDVEADKWVSVTRITFPIVGGRDGGYRGFSKKENLAPGKWRVDVKTERNQIIGRVRFDVETLTSQVELEEKIL